ncbi:MAG: hypothetical protein IJG84_24495 [Kiritimatiellae bacterium]|nr:hypothetical protein [Kiritimatiellia bacterium]
MSRSKIAVVAATAFFGIALSASAGIVYPSEATTNWFTVVAGSADLTDTARWSVPTNGDAEVSSGAIQIDTDVTDPLKYQPASASGPVAVVNARISVLPNASLPPIEDLGEAQAAITVVTNSEYECLEWHGLAKTNSNATAWVPLFGNTPVSGAEYDIQIVVDNHDTTKRIRYAVTPDGGAAVVLTDTNGDAWLGNPRNADSVTAVAFAGSGTVGNFSGDNLTDDGAEIALEPEVAGYDFTNGVVKAVVTLPDNPSGSDRTVVLTVVNFDNGVTTTYDAQSVTSGGTNTWDLSDLTPGGTYSYTVKVKSGDDVREVKSGTFTAANWTTNCWFGLGNSSGTVADMTNGVFSGATFADSKWGVDTNAEFKVTDIAPGSNAVSRVDTRYSFESFIDAESLERLGEDAVGGIVAVGDGGGAWYAYTGINDPDTGWQALTGGVTPLTNTEYVVRAEFDFMSPTHRVRYLVSSNGVSFVPLALGTAEWISLVSQDAGSLSSVEMAGKGYVKTISAKVADRAVAESDGVKYNTLWEALRNGNGEVTLLTSATLKPSDIPAGSYGPYTIIVNGYHYVVDLSDLSGNWRFVQKGEQWYLIKSGTVYIFF